MLKRTGGHDALDKFIYALKAEGLQDLTEKYLRPPFKPDAWHDEDEGYETDSYKTLTSRSILYNLRKISHNRMGYSRVLRMELVL